MSSEDDAKRFEDLLKEIARVPDRRPPPVRSPSLTGRKLGQFLILEELGHGGMGTVYRALDEQLGRTVAVKTIHRDERLVERRQRLLREARSAARLAHPHIAVVHQVIEFEDFDFIVMELVEGETLRSLMARGLDADLAIEFAEQIADGLAHAHARGIVHRDIKPENIMVGPDRRIKILDFGLARSGDQDDRGGDAPPASDDLTRDGQILGTPRYMAPEQRAGRPSDTRSDVFSFGVVLQELREAAGAMPRRFKKIGDRCLAEAPAARFPDARGVLDAWRRARRSPVRPAAAVVAALAIVAGGVAASTHFFSPPPILPRQVTYNPQEIPISYAALSPDGERVAFVDAQGLGVQKIRSSHATRIPLPSPAMFVTWSRDGRELWVVVEESPGHNQVLTLSPETGERHVVTRGPFQSLAPSPDGRRLVLESITAISIMNSDGTDLRPLRATTAPEIVSAVEWMPDGERVAAELLDSFGRHARIELIPRDGRSATTVLEDDRLFAEGMTIGADGRLYYALRDPPPWGTGTSIFAQVVEPAVGRAQQLLHLEDAHIPQLSASRTGRIEYLRYHSQTDVYVGELSPGNLGLANLHRATLSDRNQYPSQWSRHGDLLYTSHETDAVEIVQQAPGEAPQSLVGGGDDKSGPVLASDGSLLYWRMPTRTEVELVRRDEHGPRVLFTTHRAATSANALFDLPVRFRCPRNGSVCVLSELVGHVARFSRFDPSEGTLRHFITLPAPVDERNLSGWSLSADGQAVVIPLSDGKLRILRVGADPFDLSVSENCYLLFADWAAGAEGVFVTGRCREVTINKLFYVPLAGKPSVLLESRDVPYFSPLASPDGRHLAIGMTRPSDVNLWTLDAAR